MVSFYHRVANHFPTSWSITQDAFEQHVRYCLKHLKPATLDEVQTLISSGVSYEPTITFTFDDGYRENCEFAIPLLSELSVPCVYFVAVNHIINQQPFEHDLRANQPLPVNTVNELRCMAEAGIEIGLHTFNHVDFSKVTSQEEVDYEIAESKDKLEQLIGCPVRYFAFPYGLPEQITEMAVATIRREGLQAFCSAFGAYNMPGNDPFHIRRFHGDQNFSQFRKWIAFDRNKVSNEPEILYPPEAAPTAASPIIAPVPTTGSISVNQGHSV